MLQEVLGERSGEPGTPAWAPRARGQPDPGQGIPGKGTTLASVKASFP